MMKIINIDDFDADKLLYYSPQGFHDYVPQPMLKMPNWGLWKAERRGNNKRMNKIPIDAKTGGMASSTDRTTWSDYATAEKALEKYEADGISFFVEEPIMCLDVDEIRGEIDQYLTNPDELPENAEIKTAKILTKNSYMERSMSGNGFHVFFIGDSDRTDTRKGHYEIYRKARFIAMTGNSLNKGGDGLQQLSSVETKQLYNHYLGKEKQVNHDLVNNLKNLKVSTPDVQTVIDTIESMDDEALAKKLFHGVHDYTKPDGEPDGSRADLAFVNCIAKLCGYNPDIIDRVYRRSSLMRAKWDERRGAQTYGMDTIQKSLSTIKVPEKVNVMKTGDWVYAPVKGEDDVDWVLEDSFDDTGNGRRFYQYAKGRALAFIQSNQKTTWYLWNGKVWKRDDDRSVSKIVDKITDMMLAANYRPPVPPGLEEKDKKRISDNKMKEWKQHIKSSRNKRGKEAMLSEAAYKMPVHMSDFDADDYKVNCANGVVDLKTLEIAPHDKDLMCAKITSASFHAPEEAADLNGALEKAPQFLEFLKSITGNDDEMILYLLEVLATGLIGNNNLQKAFMFYGKGRNGKSVLTSVISQIYGDYAQNVNPEQFSSQVPNAGAPNPEIAEVQGRRLLVASELPENSRLNEAFFKRVTGQDEITVRRLQSNKIERFTVDGTLIMLVNSLPRFSEGDLAMQRRIEVVPFDVQIPEEKIDPQLKNKLLNEVDEIFSVMCIAAHILLMSNCVLVTPQKVETANKNYHAENDSLQDFLNINCKVEMGNKKLFTTTATFTEAYNQYLTSQGQYQISTKLVTQRLINKFGDVVNNQGKNLKKVSGKPMRVYYGIKLNPGNAQALEN